MIDKNVPQNFWVCADHYRIEVFEYIYGLAWILKDRIDVNGHPSTLFANQHCWPLLFKSEIHCEMVSLQNEPPIQTNFAYNTKTNFYKLYGKSFIEVIN